MVDQNDEIEFLKHEVERWKSKYEDARNDYSELKNDIKCEYKKQIEFENKSASLRSDRQQSKELHEHFQRVFQHANRWLIGCRILLIAGVATAIFCAFRYYDPWDDVLPAGVLAVIVGGLAWRPLSRQYEEARENEKSYREVVANYDDRISKMSNEHRANRRRWSL